MYADIPLGRNDVLSSAHLFRVGTSHHHVPLARANPGDIGFRVHFQRAFLTGIVPFLTDVSS